MDGWEALADEDGVFSTAEAMSAGFTARDLRQLVRSDAVVRLDRGWYGLTEAMSSDFDSPWGATAATARPQSPGNHSWLRKPRRG